MTQEQFAKAEALTNNYKNDINTIDAFKNYTKVSHESTVDRRQSTRPIIGTLYSTFEVLIDAEKQKITNTFNNNMLMI